MSATAAASATPHWAIMLWCDQHRIYVQLPSQNGPCVLDYTRDAKGLSEVLALMKTRHRNEGAEAAYVAPPIPVKPRVPLTPNSRDVVRDLLRRKGILGAKP